MLKKISFCLASCNRFDLLKKTLDSFFSLNKYPIEKCIIAEDSTVVKMREDILNNYGDKVELIFNDTNLGPFKTFDKLYAEINTEYIFHCEDDWLFQNNENFMQDSLDILEERQDIGQVWLRPMSDFNISAVFEDEILSTSTGVKYRLIKKDCGNGWCGFSGNAGLRRLSDYKRIFPNGYSEFVEPNTYMVFSEYNCNLQAAKHGWRAAILINHAVSHIGDGRSTLQSFDANSVPTPNK